MSSTHQEVIRYEVSPEITDTEEIFLVWNMRGACACCRHRYRAE